MAYSPFHPISTILSALVAKFLKVFEKIFFGGTGGCEKTKKAASNAKRYPLCENCQFPLSRKPTVSCLLRLRPNPHRTQKLCSGTQNKSCGYAIFQIAQKKRCDSESKFAVAIIWGRGTKVMVLLKSVLLGKSHCKFVSKTHFPRLHTIQFSDLTYFVLANHLQIAYLL